MFYNKIKLNNIYLMKENKKLEKNLSFYFRRLFLYN